MNYILGSLGIATTIVMALTGYFSSSVSAVDNKVEDLKTKVADDKALTAERLGSIDTNIANIKDLLNAVNKKLK